MNPSTITKAHTEFRKHLNGTVEIDDEIQDFVLDRNADGLNARFSDRYLEEMGDEDWVNKAVSLRDALEESLIPA